MQPALGGLSSENEYEQQRLERIQRNAVKLQQLTVQQRLADLHRPTRPTLGIQKIRAQSQRAKEPARKQPIRISARVRGVAADGAPSGSDAATTSHPDEAITSGQELMTQQEYLTYIGKESTGIATEGHFNGWVCPAICQLYGIADCAASAWSEGGGGKFSFKINKSAIPASLKAQGYSNARAFSATQLTQNPNAFFYRNVAPGQQQAFGDWSEEEHSLFLNTAEKHGVGDKWGLFASYIPQRVGYQCSAYYRDVIIPACLVLDSRFRLTPQGKAIFAGG
ncbi:hypothetical protein ABBQ32_000356 [Trebouxia sp. C0010 RCD-2024]